MPYHKLTSEITDLLKKNSVWFETFEHEPVRTSEEASKIRTGYTIHQGAKAMIIRIKISNTEKKFVMLVIPGDMRFDNDIVKELFNAKDIRFATEEEVDHLTNGVLPGGVPPFGNLFGLEVYVDPLLLENEKIVFNAGDRSFSIGMYSRDYQEIVKPNVKKLINLEFK
ncbi:MAG TPA: YbaK/EbsC family protein [Candidatus Dojkabacteria bacterium]|nr:YbaK/EbsC family protein [Candidatus Dojkabacteria bacterium]